MEKQVVLFDGVSKGVSKEKQTPFYAARFFQIVNTRWGTRRVDVAFFISEEQYAVANAFVEENKCVFGDVLEIGIKMCKNLTREPKFVKILRVVEPSPLIKYAVSDEEDDFDEDELSETAPEFVKVDTKKK